jgi:hypothetical protein
MSFNKICLFFLACVACVTASGGCELPWADDAVGGVAPLMPPSGGRAPAPGPSEPVACLAGARLIADTAVAAGKTAGAVLAGCPGPLTELSWSQTAGAPVELLAARSQAISFEPTEAGSYVFQVAYRDAGGLAQSRTVAVMVSALPMASHITVRSDQAVRELGNASVRATGTIHLAAEYFWLTPAQRDLIDEAPDYRSEFDDELAFSALTRWTVGGKTAWPSYRRDARVVRSVADLAGVTGRVLFHELTHALDLFPVAAQASLDPSKTPQELLSDRFRAGQYVSSVLTEMFPLTSMEMKALGKVMFAGTKATDLEKTYQPATIAEFFRTDVANDTYNYSNPREDLAMLVEELLMAHRRGTRRDIAITNKFTPGLTSNQLFVAWGQRGRIGDPALRARLQPVLEQILPWIPLPSMASLPAPIPMAPGITWGASLQLPAAAQRPGASPPHLTEETLGSFEDDRARQSEHLRFIALPESPRR